VRRTGTMKSCDHNVEDVGSISGTEGKMPTGIVTQEQTSCCDQPSLSGCMLCIELAQYQDENLPLRHSGPTKLRAGQVNHMTLRVSLACLPTQILWQWYLRALGLRVVHGSDVGP
jgi:hypothetical protein